MILIIGLGNPGEKFKKSRHNLGRLVVSSWQFVGHSAELSRSPGFPDFKFKKKFNALISKGIFDKNKIILALPETFMNKSGESVKSLTTEYKIQNTNLLVVHDDIDLPLGKIRISKGRGSAGHKGVESVIKELGTKNFIRLRIGIRPENFKPKNVEKFVLEKFNEKEWHKTKEIINRSGLAIEMITERGLANAMAKYNQ